MGITERLSVRCLGSSFPIRYKTPSHNFQAESIPSFNFYNGFDEDSGELCGDKVEVN